MKKENYRHFSRMGQRIKQIMVLLLLISVTNLIFSVPCGDVNSSGSIDIVDALMTAQYYVGLNPQGFDQDAADVSGDGVINIVDALQVAQFYVGLIPGLSGCSGSNPIDTTIYYASDSTVRHYEQNSNKQQGVGQRLPEFLSNNISIANYAKGGRAISGFLNDGFWKDILDASQPGDYVLIQFGINDRGDVPDKEDFKNYLRRYVNDARAKQITPVFVTPTPRFQYDSNGVFTNAFTKYCEAKFEVGTELGVIVIDLQTKGRDFFTEIGPSRVDKEMMMDTLHPLADGAYHLARLLAEGISESSLTPLKNSVITANLDPNRPQAVDGWNPRDGYTHN